MNYVESENFNAQEIAEETENLNRILALIREEIAVLKNDGFSYRTIDFYDINEVEDFQREAVEHSMRQTELSVLQKSLDTPYFARMRLKATKRTSLNLDRPSMTRARTLTEDEAIGEDADIYVGANVIFYRNKIIVFSHNSPLGNKVYERFDSGTVEYGGYEYKVIFRRKFDIRAGKLEAVFQDYSESSGGIVYDKFLAHMLKVKRGDKRLTDIIPTIQANQNAIIIRPADENCIVSGCAGCGKTMLLLQRLEYLSFNKKAELGEVTVIAPGERYIKHIQPVVDDLMINAARRITMGELYRQLILSMHGIKSEARRVLSGAPISDESLPDEIVTECYGDAVKRKLISALAPLKQAYREKRADYRARLERYENEVMYSVYSSHTLKKPPLPVIAVDLKNYSFIPDLGDGLTRCKLYLLLTAYCYVLGKPDFNHMLFIDEGQDYFLNEYRLLADCTRSVMNIYGDTNQQPNPKRGLSDFSLLDGLRDYKKYYLNENYRNAREITEYVNELLDMNVTSLGLDGGSVSTTDYQTMFSELDSFGDDRIAVIYSSNDLNAKNILEGRVKPDMLYTVMQCKGMEYERVYACGEFNDKEKYVAYTRALDTLKLVK